MKEKKNLILCTGPILESKDLHAMFKKRAQNSKIFRNLYKYVQNLKIFLKRASGCVQLSHILNC